MTRGKGLALLLISTLAASIVASAESHARIVRLSYLDGKVQMDRATGQGLERAMLNAPVVQGARIVTEEGGLAEVEFEDQSALRLAGNSEVKFRRLSLNDAGAKINDIEVAKGTVFLDTRSKGHDLYRLAVNGTSFVVRPGTQMRMTAGTGPEQVAVSKGNVLLENQPQLANVSKKETLTLDAANPAGYTIAKGVEVLPVDAWNREREAYDNAYAQSEGIGPRSGYGLQDLNYYGSFFYAPGYGTVWQPFGFSGTLASSFSTIGWNPYLDGAWMFYPGMGYSWASSYPWGWLPYHYGSWAFVGGTGWVWVPGNSWRGNWYANNYQPAPLVTKSPAGWNAPAPPANSPASTSNPTVLVGKTISPAFIPGGRIPPDFASVMPGHKVAATAIAVAPNHAARTEILAESVVMPRTSHASRSGHVFIAPAPSAVGIGPSSAGVGVGPAAAGTVAPSAISSSHAGGAPAAHSGGGGTSHH